MPHDHYLLTKIMFWLYYHAEPKGKLSLKIKSLSCYWTNNDLNFRNYISNFEISVIYDANFCTA